MGDQTKQALEELLAQRCGVLLAQIQALFKPGAIATLIVRYPENPTGRADFMLTGEADPERAVGSLRKLVATRPELHVAVNAPASGSTCLCSSSNAATCGQLRGLLGAVCPCECHRPPGSVPDRRRRRLP